MKRMLKIIRLLLLLPAGLLLAGCATEQYYANAVRSWSGARDKQLFRAWGYPDHMQRLPRGHHLYVYRHHATGSYPTVVTPGYTTIQTAGDTTYVSSTPTIYSGGGVYNLNCTTWFELNTKGVIVNTSYRGNDCVATESVAARLTYRQAKRPK